jgi:DUF1009 family protein
VLHRLGADRVAVAVLARAERVDVGEERVARDRRVVAVEDLQELVRRLDVASVRVLVEQREGLLQPVDT